MPPALLAIEVGNTRLKFGLFDRGRRPAAGELPRCRSAVRVRAGDDPFPALRSLLADSGVNGATAVYAGVNPTAAAALLDRWPADLGEAPRPLPAPRLAVRTDADETDPAPRVGIDRLLGAVAALRLVPNGGTPPRGAVVADCGTATTVDLVTVDGGGGGGDEDEDGEAGRGVFRGGAILPGPDLCARALHEHTALLPRVDLTAAGGSQTERAVRRGVLTMQAAAVDRLLAEGLARCGPAGGTAILTGGAAPLIAELLTVPGVRHEPDLTLQGLFLTARGW